MGLRDDLALLKDPPAGDDLATYLTKSRLAAMLKAIRALACGEHISVSGGRISRAEGAVTISIGNQKTSFSTTEGTFYLPFQVRPSDSQQGNTAIVNVQPGILSGSPISAGIGESMQEYFPQYQGDELTDFPAIPITQSQQWRHLGVYFEFEPIPVELWGVQSALEVKITEAEIRVLAQIPPSEKASLGQNGGPVQIGKTFKTIALVRQRNADSALEIMQISYGNWSIVSCEDATGGFSIHCFEPNYITQIVNIPVTET